MNYNIIRNILPKLLSVGKNTGINEIELLDHEIGIPKTATENDYFRTHSKFFLIYELKIMHTCPGELQDMYALLVQCEFTTGVA